MRERPRKVNNGATATATSAKCGGSNYPPPQRSSLRWSECTFCCKVTESLLPRGHMTSIRHRIIEILAGWLLCEGIAPTRHIITGLVAKLTASLFRQKRQRRFTTDCYVSAGMADGRTRTAVGGRPQKQHLPRRI